MHTSLAVQPDDNWRQLLQFLPTGWQDKAKELRAYHRLRAVSSVELLLRILLVHLVDGVSLAQTANIAAQAGWADLSDVSILKRLRQAEAWFRWMSLELVTQQQPAWLTPYHVRSVDATVVSEPGSTGTNWRVHYSLGLFDLACEAFQLTDPSTGETVRNFTFQPDDLVVADRAYCSGKGIAWLHQHQASYLLRYKPKRVSLCVDPDRHQPFALLEQVRDLGLQQPRSWILVPPETVPALSDSWR